MIYSRRISGTIVFLVSIASTVFLHSKVIPPVHHDWIQEQYFSSDAPRPATRDKAGAQEVITPSLTSLSPLLNPSPTLFERFHISNKTRKLNLVLFYNVYLNPLNSSTSIEIVKDQLQTRKGSFLASHAPLFYLTIGERVANLTALTNCYNCHHLDHLDKGNELDTLEYLYHHCQKFPDNVALYFHNKGSYTMTLRNERLRYHLTRGVFTDFCLEKFLKKRYTACSTKFAATPFFGFTGNFFTASCAYVQKLLSPKQFQEAKNASYEAMKASKQSDYFRIGGKPWATDRASWLGIGRYASEHWIGSHPSFFPAQVYPNERFHYKMKEISKDWQPRMRPPSLPTKDKNFMKGTLPPWFHLPGKMFEWNFIYHEIPHNKSWVWSLFKDVQILNWTHLFNKSTIVIFYHIDIPVNSSTKALEIVREQLVERRKSLPVAGAPVYYITTGAETDISGHCSTNCERVKHIPNGTQLDTVNSLYHYCMNHPLDRVVYMYNKGADGNDEEVSDRLRLHLSRGIFSHDCLETAFDHNFTSCSVRFNTIPYFHFTGNMWTASCEYIQKLLPPRDYVVRRKQLFDDIQNNPKLLSYYFGNETGMLHQDGMLGIGDYALAPWINSHPLCKPADIFPATFAYKTEKLSIIWKARLRPPSLDRRQRMYSWGRTDQWSYIPGREYEWNHFYPGEVPENSSWIWDVFYDPLNDSNNER